SSFMRPFRQTPFHSLTAHRPRGVEACLDVLALQPRKILEDALVRLTRRQHPQDMLHRQAPPANDGFTTENLRVIRDTCKQFGFVHRRILSRSVWIKSPIPSSVPAGRQPSTLIRPFDLGSPSRT